MKFAKFFSGPLATILVVIFVHFQASSGIRVGSDGGYEVKLALKNDVTSAPINVQTYVNNIKNIFQTLSFQMWIATKSNFYIKSLEIVVPESWNIATSGVTNFSYNTADVRVSTAVTTPYVENPNLCGLPGDYMELPLGIFQTANSGTWGEHWKALLVEWARYRWGAYEEHGIPGNARFPYFTRDFEAAEGEPRWVPNGCTNAPGNKLAGEYRHRTNGTPCNASSIAELDTECRFYPNKNENLDVTSSLMHFHFMESVTLFCDATTHQKHVPTKQNLYCDNKSVMETIESTPDFKSVTTKSENVPNLRTTLFKAVSTPAVYLLLDTGIDDTNDALIINNVMVELGNFIQNPAGGFPQDAIVGMGVVTPTASSFQELVPLGFLSENRERIADAIGNREVIYNPIQDIGLALEQVAGIIKAKSPSDGGNILFVKTTGARNESTFSIEREVQLSLQRNNIKLFALEVADVNLLRQNLVALSAATGGGALTLDIRNSSTISALVVNWLNTIVLPNYVTLPSHGRLERATFRQSVVPGQLYTVPVMENVQSLTFILTTAVRIPTTNLFAGIRTPNFTIAAMFSQSNEWGLSRFVYTGTLGTRAWTFNQVTFNYSGTSEGHLLVYSDGDALPAEISVRVVTTAVNNEVDLGNIANPDAPFVVTAELVQNNRPVVGASVLASIQMLNQPASEVQLVESLEGIENPLGSYSAIVLFPEDGEYSIAVTVTKGNAAAYSTSMQSSSRILPPDQNFGTVIPVTFPVGATLVSRLESNIRVSNKDLFVPTIQRIRDFVINPTPSPTMPEAVVFEFHVPRLFNLSDSQATPNSYAIYASENQSLLLDLDVNNLPPGVTVRLNGSLSASLGSPFQIIVDEMIYRDATTFYAVATFSETTSSRVSNTAVIPALQEPDLETTTDTTNPTPTSSQPEPTPAEKKPWLKTTGGIVTIVVIVLVCFAAAVGGYWYMNKRRKSKGVIHSA